MGSGCLWHGIGENQFFVGQFIHLLVVGDSPNASFTNRKTIVWQIGIAFN